VIDEIDDLAAPAPLDRRMRAIDETREPGRQPVIAPRLAQRLVHALLDDDPFAVVGDDEAMQVEIEAILDGGAVDLGDQPAGARQRRAIDAGARAHGQQFIRRPARLRTAAAADMQAELARQGRQAALERAEHAGGDAGRVPVHAHHCAEGLEPERMRQASEKFVTPIVLDDRLGNQHAEPGHAVAQPFRHAAAMQR
jgi:hypothetical protein